MCSLCWKLKRALKAAKSNAAEKLRVANLLREHWQEQLRDRVFYWSLRSCSRLKLDGLLSIIVDSLDKSKTIVPRFASHSSNKELGNLPNRPNCTITLAVAHGFGSFVYITDEGGDHGSTLFLNIIFDVIERCKRICRRRNLNFPRHLHLQARDKFCNVQQTLWDSPSHQHGALIRISVA